MERQAASALPLLSRPFAIRELRHPSAFLASYLSESSEVTELFSAMARLPPGNGSRLAVEMLCVFRTVILLAPGGAGLRIIRRFLRSSGHYLLAGLNGNSPRLIKAVLALMAAIAGHSVSAARALVSRVSPGYKPMPVLGMMRAPLCDGQCAFEAIVTAGEEVDESEPSRARAVLSTRAGSETKLSLSEVSRRLQKLKKRCEAVMARLRGSRSKAGSHDSVFVMRVRAASSKGEVFAMADSVLRPLDGFGLGGTHPQDDVRFWWVQLVSNLALCPANDVRSRVIGAPLVMRTLLRGAPYDPPDSAARIAACIVTSVCLSSRKPVPARVLASLFDRTGVASMLRLYHCKPEAVAHMDLATVTTVLGHEAAAGFPVVSEATAAVPVRILAHGLACAMLGVSVAAVADLSSRTTEARSVRQGRSVFGSSLATAVAVLRSASASSKDADEARAAEMGAHALAVAKTAGALRQDSDLRTQRVHTAMWMLGSLASATDPLQERLLRATLVAYPSAAAAFFFQLPVAVDPRPSLPWRDSMLLLSSLLSPWGAPTADPQTTMQFASSLSYQSSFPRMKLPPDQRALKRIPRAPVEAILASFLSSPPSSCSAAAARIGDLRQLLVRSSWASDGEPSSHSSSSLAAAISQLKGAAFEAFHGPLGLTPKEVVARIVPDKLARETLSRGLLHAHPHVVAASLQVLSSLLDRCGAAHLAIAHIADALGSAALETLDTSNEAARRAAASVVSLALRHGMEEALRGELTAALPSVQTLMSLRAKFQPIVSLHLQGIASKEGALEPSFKGIAKHLALPPTPWNFDSVAHLLPLSWQLLARTLAITQPREPSFASLEACASAVPFPWREQAVQPALCSVQSLPTGFDPLSLIPGAALPSHTDPISEAAIVAAKLVQGATGPLSCLHASAQQALLDLLSVAPINSPRWLGMDGTKKRSRGRSSSAAPDDDGADSFVSGRSSVVSGMMLAGGAAVERTALFTVAQAAASTRDTTVQRSAEHVVASVLAFRPVLEGSYPIASSTSLLLTSPTEADAPFAPSEATCFAQALQAVHQQSAFAPSKASKRSKSAANRFTCQDGEDLVSSACACLVSIARSGLGLASEAAAAGGEVELAGEGPEREFDRVLESLGVGYGAPLGWISRAALRALFQALHSEEGDHEDDDASVGAVSIARSTTASTVALQAAVVGAQNARWLLRRTLGARLFLSRALALLLDAPSMQRALEALASSGLPSLECPALSTLFALATRGKVSQSVMERQHLAEALESILAPSSTPSKKHKKRAREEAPPTLSSEELTASLREAADDPKRLQQAVSVVRKHLLHGASQARAGLAAWIIQHAAAWSSVSESDLVALLLMLPLLAPPRGSDDKGSLSFALAVVSKTSVAALLFRNAPPCLLNAARADAGSLESAAPLLEGDSPALDLGSECQEVCRVAARTLPRDSLPGTLVQFAAECAPLATLLVVPSLRAVFSTLGSASTVTACPADRTLLAYAIAVSKDASPAIAAQACLSIASSEALQLFEVLVRGLIEQGDPASLAALEALGGAVASRPELPPSLLRQFTSFSLKAAEQAHASAVEAVSSGRLDAAVELLPFLDDESVAKALQEHPEIAPLVLRHRPGALLLAHTEDLRQAVARLLCEAVASPHADKAFSTLMVSPSLAQLVRHIGWDSSGGAKPLCKALSKHLSHALGWSLLRAALSALSAEDTAACLQQLVRKGDIDSVIRAPGFVDLVGDLAAPAAVPSSMQFALLQHCWRLLLTGAEGVTRLACGLCAVVPVEQLEELSHEVLSAPLVLHAGVVETAVALSLRLPGDAAIGIRCALLQQSLHTLAGLLAPPATPEASSLVQTCVVSALMILRGPDGSAVVKAAFDPPTLSHARAVVGWGVWLCLGLESGRRRSPPKAVATPRDDDADSVASSSESDSSSSSSSSDESDEDDEPAAAASSSSSAAAAATTAHPEKQPRRRGRGKVDLENLSKVTEWESVTLPAISAVAPALFHLMELLVMWGEPFETSPAMAGALLGPCSLTRRDVGLRVMCHPGFPRVASRNIVRLPRWVGRSVRASLGSCIPGDGTAPSPAPVVSTWWCASSSLVLAVDVTPAATALRLVLARYEADASLLPPALLLPVVRACYRASLSDCDRVSARLMRILSSRSKADPATVGYAWSSAAGAQFEPDAWSVALSRFAASGSEEILVSTPLRVPLRQSTEWAYSSAAALAKSQLDDEPGHSSTPVTAADAEDQPRTAVGFPPAWHMLSKWHSSEHGIPTARLRATELHFASHRRFPSDQPMREPLWDNALAEDGDDDACAPITSLLGDEAMAPRCSLWCPLGASRRLSDLAPDRASTSGWPAPLVPPSPPQVQDGPITFAPDLPLCSAIPLIKVGGAFLSEQHLRSQVFDPVAMLALASYLFTNAGVPTKRFVASGLLTTPLLALSASHEQVRARGYGIVASLFAALAPDSSRSSFPEAEQLHLLIGALKASVSRPLEQLPRLTVLFAARAAAIVLRPASPVFRPLGKLLTKSSVLPTRSVPLLQPAMLSHGAGWRSTRAFVVRLLLAGVADAQSYNAVAESGAFDWLAACVTSLSSEPGLRSMAARAIAQAAGLAVAWAPRRSEQGADADDTPLLARPLFRPLSTHMWRATGGASWARSVCAMCRGARVLEAVGPAFVAASTDMSSLSGTLATLAGNGAPAGGALGWTSQSLDWGSSGPLQFALAPALPLASEEMSVGVVPAAEKLRFDHTQWRQELAHRIGGGDLPPPSALSDVARTLRSLAAAAQSYVERREAELGLSSASGEEAAARRAASVGREITEAMCEVVDAVIEYIALPDRTTPSLHPTAACGAALWLLVSMVHACDSLGEWCGGLDLVGEIRRVRVRSVVASIESLCSDQKSPVARAVLSIVQRL
jgi:hypothetical protein